MLTEFLFLALLKEGTNRDLILVMGPRKQNKKKEVIKDW